MQSAGTRRDEPSERSAPPRHAPAIPPTAPPITPGTPPVSAPPAAPIDTLVGIGTGRFNNVDGYTIEFTLSDHGEPGDFDEAAFLIYPDGDPGNPVLDVPLQRLDGGNLQAHADQPHN